MASSPSAKTSPFPDLNVIQPTSPRSYKQSHRLLYRGALSLPDSDLTLDGITFTAHLLPASPTTLLDSPVALSLESMRGRPCLRFVSCVNLEDVPHEFAGNINMYIHPRSTLTCGFFENVLCTGHVGSNGHTTTAIRIGLGDGHGPEDNDLLILGTLLPSQSTLRMAVARVTPSRPVLPPGVRPPRPDDPAPRRPPILDVVGRNLAKKRHQLDPKYDTNSEERSTNPRKMLKVPNLSKPGEMDTMFTLPDAGVDPRVRGKGRENGHTAPFKVPWVNVEVSGGEDVFGTCVVSTSSKHAHASDMEALNKTLVKKSAVKSLTVRGMPKEHPSFRELFGWITRGVGFALRNKLKTVKLSSDEVQRLVDSHVLMYFDGFGGPSREV